MNFTHESGTTHMAVRKKGQLIKSQAVTTPRTNKETELIRLQNLNSQISERGTQKEMQGQILQNPKSETPGDCVRRNPKKPLNPKPKRIGLSRIGSIIDPKSAY